MSDTTDLMQTGIPSQAAVKIATGMATGTFSGAIAAGTTVTAGTGLVATTGGVTVTAGNVVFSAAQAGVKDNIGTLAALGTNQATAAPIVTTICRVTAADGTVGVVLPAASTALIGRTILVINSDVTSALKLYAAGSDTITGQAGSTAISIAAKLMLRCVCYSATEWYAEKGVLPY
jgi:hypothetical protein